MLKTEGKGWDFGWTHSHKEGGTYRWWWHPPERVKKFIRGVQFEISRVQSLYMCFRFTVDSEPTIGLSISIPHVCYIHFGFDHPKEFEWQKKFGKSGDMGFTYEGREISLSWNIEHHYISWNWWVDPSGWSSKRPKWRDGSFYYLDFLLGRHIYKCEEIESRVVQLDMPEGIYSCHIQLSKDTWTRKRFPFLKKSRLGAMVIPEYPIPVPGKGENSWDCGEDAVFSSGCIAATYDEAIQEIKESVMRDRNKYGGGERWRPSETWDMNYIWKEKVLGIKPEPPKDVDTAEDL